MPDERPLTPDDERRLEKVRRLMVITTTTTFLAVAAVLGVIGYRVLSMGERAPDFAAVTAELPAGARVVSTALGDNRILVTVEVGGATELHTFDAGTLKPLGRLRLERK